MKKILAVGSIKGTAAKPDSDGGTADWPKGSPQHLTIVRRHPSKSRPGVSHVTSVQLIVGCGCEGFVGHGKCWHVAAALEELQQAIRRMRS